MLRRSFFKLASAAVIGVLASKVPVFAEDPVADFLAQHVQHASSFLSHNGMRIITVPAFTLPSGERYGGWTEVETIPIGELELVPAEDFDRAVGLLRGEGAVKPL